MRSIFFICGFSIFILTHFLSSLKTVCEVNLAPAVNRMLSNCDNIIQQHKAACLRVTSLLAHKDIIWVGTSAGVLLTILAQNIGKNTPVVTGKFKWESWTNYRIWIYFFHSGIPQGHTGHVRFLTSVEIDETASTKRISTSNDSTSNYVLIISGGDGYEDFRTNGTNTMNEVAGREDSTNHLLMWQQIL